MFAVKIETTNDRNGNPRRGWFVYDVPGNCVAFVDEGGEGEAALARRFPAFKWDTTPGKAIVTLVLRVPASEYIRALKVERDRNATPKTKGTPKTEVVWVLQANYGYGQGWEDVTEEDNEKDARDALNDYLNNVTYAVRVIKRRVPKVES